MPPARPPRESDRRQGAYDRNDEHQQHTPAAQLQQPDLRLPIHPPPPPQRPPPTAPGRRARTRTTQAGAGTTPKKKKKNGEEESQARGAAHAEKPSRRKP